MIVKLEQRIETRKDVSALTVRLTGNYKDVNYSEAWDKIINYCMKENRVGCIDAEYISVYLDDPTTTPAEKCRVDVCIAHPVLNGLQPEGEVGVEVIEGGKFIVFLHKGPYTELGQVYEEVYGHLLQENGVEVLPKPMFEKYLNDPALTKPEDLLTELWIPIA